LKKIEGLEVQQNVNIDRMNHKMGELDEKYNNLKKSASKEGDSCKKIGQVRGNGSDFKSHDNSSRAPFRDS